MFPKERGNFLKIFSIPFVFNYFSYLNLNADSTTSNSDMDMDMHINDDI